MKNQTRNLLFNPVWLLFIPPLLGRSFLWLHITSLSTAIPQTRLIAITNFLLLLLFVVLAGYVAAVLAAKMRLSERGQERFMVMSALGALTPPLEIAKLELTDQFDFMLSLLALLGLFFCLFRLIQRGDGRASWRILAVFPLSVGLVGGLILWLRTPLLPLLIAIVLPFFGAVIFVLPYVVQQRTEKRPQEKGKKAEMAKLEQSRKRVSAIVMFHICMLAMIGLYFSGLIYTYVIEIKK